MNPRIEKKVSKKLVKIAPKLFKGAWVDNEVEYSPKYWPHRLDRELTAKEKKVNTQLKKCRVNHIYSVGGGYCSYVGDCDDHFTCYDWLKNNYCWVFNFPTFPAGHELAYYPDTKGFKPTTRNLIRLAKSYESKKRA